MTFQRFPWLTTRPIAHRGLHTPAGPVENTLDAIEAAVNGGLGVEIDVQLSQDGEVIVFHDLMLDRLTSETGPVGLKSAAELKNLQIGKSSSTIPTLPQVLEVTSGKSPLFIELKSRFLPQVERDLTSAVVRDMANRPEQIALMSFDPRIVATLLREAPDIPRGIIYDGAMNDEDWSEVDPLLRASMYNFGHWPISQPDFLACDVSLLPKANLRVMKWLTNIPILTWTVRTQKQLAIARDNADQVIFEGIDPEAILA